MFHHRFQYTLLNKWLNRKYFGTKLAESSIVFRIKITAPAVFLDLQALNFPAFEQLITTFNRHGSFELKNVAKTL